jgi:hypothetical protein
MRLGRLLKFGLIGIVALLALSWVGIWVYINVFKEDPPPPLSFDTLDAATTTLSAGSAASTCSPLSFENGRAVFTVADPGDAAKKIIISSEAISGTVSVCDGTVQSGTVDVDVSSAVAEGDDADTADALGALQAAEFPVVSLTIDGAGSGSAVVAGEERQVPVEVTVDGSSVTVTSDLS